MKTRYRLALAAGGSANQANISAKIIKSLKVPYPPIEEQKLIARILSTLDEKIEVNNQINKNLEKMTQSIFKHWFIDFEFPNEEGESYKSSGGEMLESEIGMIPRGWKVETIGDVCDVIDCLHSKKPEDIQEGDNILLQVYNIGENGKIDLSSKYLVNETDYETWTRRIQVTEGDIIISKTGRVGAIAQIPYWLKAGIGRNLVGIRVKKIISKSYLRDYVNSNYMKKEIALRTNEGTILKSLHVKEIKKIRVLIPSIEVLSKFDKVVKDIHKR